MRRMMVAAAAALMLVATACGGGSSKASSATSPASTAPSTAKAGSSTTEPATQPASSSSSATSAGCDKPVPATIGYDASCPYLTESLTFSGAVEGTMTDAVYRYLSGSHETCDFDREIAGEKPTGVTLLGWAGSFPVSVRLTQTSGPMVPGTYEALSSLVQVLDPANSSGRVKAFYEGKSGTFVLDAGRKTGSVDAEFSDGSSTVTLKGTWSCA